MLRKGGFPVNKRLQTLPLQVRKWLAMGKSTSDCQQKDVRSLQMRLLEVKMLLASLLGGGVVLDGFDF